MSRKSSAMTTDKAAKLAAYIQREVSKDPARALDLHTPLISSGLVDSMSLVAILVFIEDEFGVAIPDEAATGAGMNTIKLILDLIQTYDSSGGNRASRMELA